MQGEVSTPQAVNQSPQTARNPPAGGFHNPSPSCPRGERGKGPSARPQTAQGQRAGLPRARLLPLLCLSPSPSAAFTVVAIKCQLLGVRNNKHCNSAQSQHPLRVSETVRPVTGRLRGPATPPASAVSAPSVNRDGDRVAVALGQRMKGCRGMEAACSLSPSLPTPHSPRGRMAQIRSSHLLPISANARGALGAAHKAPKAAWGSGPLSGAQGWAKRELLPCPKENLPRGAHPREPEGHGVCDKGDQGVPA